MRLSSLRTWRSVRCLASGVTPLAVFPLASVRAQAAPVKRHGEVPLEKTLVRVP